MTINQLGKTGQEADVWESQLQRNWMLNDFDIF
jgi:hypothetical protein